MQQELTFKETCASKDFTLHGILTLLGSKFVILQCDTKYNKSLTSRNNTINAVFYFPF